jgi:hypothetical protein
MAFVIGQDRECLIDVDAISEEEIDNDAEFRLVKVLVPEQMIELNVAELKDSSIHVVIDKASTLTLKSKEVLESSADDG